MPIGRNHRRTRIVMVVTRSSTHQRAVEALLEDQHRVRMERQTGDSNHVVVMASPDEVRAARAARPSTTASALAPHVVIETQRRLVRYAHRARQLLSHRSVTDQLSRARRAELWSEIQRMKEEIQTLQDQVEVTTRSVESMGRLTRDFAPPDTHDRAKVTHEITMQRSEQGGE